jgi:hypothetical protein
MIPIWYAVIAGLIYYLGRLPRWYTLIALAGLALVLLVHLIVLVTLRSNAFVADADGITLGLRGGARRRGIRRRRRNTFLPWTHIEKVSVARRRGGARLDIVARPAVPLHWPNPIWQAAATVATLALPLCCLVRAPGLLAPRRHAPDYRIRLCDADAGPLCSALTELAAPAGVQVTLTRRWRPHLPGRTKPTPAPPAAPAPLSP